MRDPFRRVSVGGAVVVRPHGVDRNVGPRRGVFTNRHLDRRHCQLLVGASDRSAVGLVADLLYRRNNGPKARGYLFTLAKCTPFESYGWNAHGLHRAIERRRELVSLATALGDFDGRAITSRAGWREAQRAVMGAVGGTVRCVV